MDDPTPADRAEIAHAHVVRELARFGERLREEGVSLSTADLLSTAETLGVVGLADRQRVRAGTRAALVRRAEDLAAFDECFPAFWYRLRTGLVDVDALMTAENAEAPSPEDTISAGMSQPSDEAEAVAEEPAAVASAESLSRRVESRSVADADEDAMSTYSATGDGDRASIDPGNQFDLRREVSALADTLGLLPGRSWSQGGSEVPDVRRTVRQSARRGSVVLDPPTRNRPRDALSCCVLVDVSKSVLETIDRSFLLATVGELHDQGRRVRTFFFDTDVQEVTTAFDGERDPHTALQQAEVQWGGGTRIGAAFATVRETAPDVIDDGTVVLIISDGLDVGDPSILESGIAWLARRASTLLWLNPLAASATYEPTCRGMATALPYVDGLFAFAEPADLRELTRQLVQRPTGPYGYQYDGRDREPEADCHT